jgi:hypothetical protein
MTSKPHKWGNWKYLVLNGRIRRKIQFPTRWHNTVKNTLKKIRIPFREIVPFKNKLYRGWKDAEPEFSIQWLDFVVYAEGKLMVLLFREREGHAYKKKAWRAKQDFLLEKNIPFLILERSYGSQEIEVLIRRFIRKNQ